MSVFDLKNKNIDLPYFNEMLEKAVTELPENYRRLYKTTEDLKEEIRTLIFDFYFPAEINFKDGSCWFLDRLPDSAKKTWSQCFIRMVNKLKTFSDEEYEKACKGIECSNPESPFRESEIAYRQRKDRKDRSEVVREIYSEINDWYTDYHKYRLMSSWDGVLVGLTDYPAFHLIKPESTQWRKLIKYDLELFTAKMFSQKRYRHYLEYLPAAVIGNGMITDSRIQALKELGRDETEAGQGNALVDEAAYNKERLINAFFKDEALAAKNIELVSYTILENRDWEYFSLLITKFLKSIRGISKTMRVQGTFTELLDSVYGERKYENCGYSSSAYAACYQSLQRLGLGTVIAKVDGTLVTKKLFESSHVDIPGETGTDRLRYNMVFGATIASNILSGLLLTVSMPERNSLDKESAVMLYDGLKLDRIMDVTINESDRHAYTLDQLQALVRFSGSKKVKEKKYIEALEDLKEKGIIVKDYVCEKGIFYIFWTPLRSAEYYDLKYNTKYLLEEKKE